MNEYTSTIEDLIQSSFLIINYRLNVERRTQDMAFISGRLDFIDGSSLDFKEFIEMMNDEIFEKYKYGYNYRKGSIIIFRYDNAPDPGAKNLHSFPHHKHTKDGKIIESHFISFSEILEEIHDHILSNWEILNSD